ncbi:hypothetical protein LXL04_008863 [Taraxacum kok-saghyz]
MSSNLFSPPKPKNYRPQKSENLNIAIQSHRSSSAANLSPPSAAAHRRSSAPLLAGVSGAKPLHRDAYSRELWCDFFHLNRRFHPRFHPISPQIQESIPIEEVFENLRCSKEGLASSAAEERLVIFVYNKLEEKKESKFLKFLGFMWNPLSWVMEVVAIISIMAIIVLFLFSDII